MVSPTTPPWEPEGALQSQETYMARLIEKPTVIAAVGNKPKRIEEYVGHVNTHTDQVSIARMHSSPGWKEPGQTPAFDEFILVLCRHAPG